MLEQSSPTTTPLVISKRKMVWAEVVRAGLVTGGMESDSFIRQLIVKKLGCRGGRFNICSKERMKGMQQVVCGSHCNRVFCGFVQLVEIWIVLEFSSCMTECIFFLIGSHMAKVGAVINVFFAQRHVAR